ncbi:MAG: hypothetical protein Q9213_004697 [Squamulea squamosa]
MDDSTSRDHDFDADDPLLSAPGDPELPSFDFPQYDGTNDEDSPRDTTASSSPTTRLSSNQNGNPRKRVHGSFTTETLAKSRKPTPSPALTGETLTGETTPNSFDNFDFSAEPHLMELLGGNPKEDLAEMLKAQKEQEQELHRKKEQEREDAEFAKQLSEQCGYELPKLSNNTFRGATSQSFIDSNGRIRRPDISITPSLFSQIAPQPILSSSPTLPLLTPKREKMEPSPPLWQEQTQREFQLPQSFKPVTPTQAQRSGGFIILDSDDDETMSTPHTKPFKLESRNIDKNIQGGDSTGSQWNNNVAGGTWNGNSFEALPGSSRALSLSETGGTNVYNALSGIAYSTSSNLPWWGSSMYGLGQSVSDMARGAWTSANGLLNSQTGLGSYQQPFIVPSSPNSSDFHWLLPTQSHILGNPERLGPPQTEYDEWFLNRYRENNDPTKTLAELKELLNNIRPDEDLPPENREGTPDAMVYPLMEHQKLGLAWMKSMEEGSNKGGILADGMGLGKTIQAIALMASRRSKDPNCKTTLIIAPVALLKQWDREIRTKLKIGLEHRLSTFTLHGSNRHATWEDLKTYDIVLTTFGTLSTEVKRKGVIDHAKRTNPNWRPSKAKSDQLPLLGDECKWYRVIIDEAQCIKNRSTKAALGASVLQAQTRFAMSGTPMQNNVTELYSLIRFLRIKPYSDFSKFSMDFSRPLKGSDGEDTDRAMRKLQALLKAILLRRDKKSTIDGKPILNLPERTTESQHATFSEDEQEFYNAVESRTQLQFNRYLKAGTVGRNYSNVLVLLLRLRQACCHPHLIKDYGVPSSAAESTSEDLEKMARELASDVVARIIEQGDRNNHSGLECPVCMDATENATIFVPCGHNTCSECFARISDPSQAIVNGDDEGSSLKCPQCRGKIVVSKLTDHVTFKKIHLPQLSATEGIKEALEGASDSDSESDDDTSDDGGSDLGGFIVDDDEETTEDENGYRKGTTPFERCSKQKKAKKAKKAKSSKGKGKAEAKAPKKTLAQLKKDSLRNMKAKKKYLARVRKTWESSAKIDRTIEILRAINARKENEKTIIFSQFTSLLDLLEVPIYDEGWKYQRYDGSMSPNARNDAVMEFSDKPACKIMLVSLRAGNAGLNLVAASQVIIMDPFWNPYVEEQAIDRAHRIGQQRPVQVHRILVPGTVEDRILALQEKKRAMIESALDENASKQVGRLGTQELSYLFVSLRPTFLQGFTDDVRVSPDRAFNA